MFRLSLFVSALLLFALQPAVPQQSTNAPSSKSSPYAAIPVEEARKENPVKSSPESLARAKKWWALDCEMCHGKTGDGKGETAKEMKLTMMDFTDSATLKDRTDGEILLHHQEWPQRHACRRPACEGRRRVGPGQLRPRLRQKERRRSQAITN